MGHTVADWHREAAEIAFGARTEHDRRMAGSHGPERDDAVTVWRHTAHILNGYANGGDGDTWEAFWGEAMSRDAYLRLIERRGRFGRCTADGEGPTNRDSIREWERSLAHQITAGERYVGAAQELRNERAIRRLSLDLDVALSIAAAYTRLSPADLRAALAKCEGRDPRYGAGEREDDHPLLALLTANRPTA